jgi:hypothetical protein
MATLATALEMGEWQIAAMRVNANKNTVFDLAIVIFAVRHLSDSYVVGICRRTVNASCFGPWRKLLHVLFHFSMICIARASGHDLPTGQIWLKPAWLLGLFAANHRVIEKRALKVA